jgi:hypothetical protein
MKSLFLAAAALALAAAAPASAADIAGLYNTGVDDNHLALVGASADDSHYQITASDSDATRVGQQAVTYNCCYIPDSATARVVSLDGLGGGQAGTSSYDTTFSLAGFNLSTVSISGDFAVDDVGRLFLNGVDTGYGNQSYLQPTAFTLSSGFNAGVNTLEFRVFNQGGPQSLRVADLAGTGTLSDAGGGAGGVPEPASWALMTVGFGGMGALLRRRRSLASQTA